MKRFIEGENRSQSTLFPESLDDYIAQDNAVRVVDAFVSKLDLKALGFDRVEPSATGRPGYQPATMLKTGRASSDDIDVAVAPRPTNTAVNPSTNKPVIPTTRRIDTSPSESSCIE